MTRPLDKPATGATFDWRFYKDWFFRLWKFVTGGPFGTGTGSDGGYGATIALSSALLNSDGSSGLNGFSNGIGGPGLYLPCRARSINGQMSVVQRGAFVASNGAAGYGGPDHFLVENVNAGGQFTQSSGSMVYQGATLTTIQQTVNTSMTNNSGTNFWSGALLQVFEGYQVVDLVGSPISISFLFTANFSGTISVSFRFTKGTQYTFLTTFACVANVQQYVSVTTPPVPSGVTVTFDNTYTADLWIGALNAGTYQGATSTSWQSGVGFITASTYTNWGVAGNITNVTLLQVEKGPPTPFEWHHFDTDLQLCQRYYYVGIIGFIGNASAAGSYTGAWYTLPRNMRVNPTLTLGTVIENTNNGAINTTVWNARDIRIWAGSAAIGQQFYDANFTASAEF